MKLKLPNVPKLTKLRAFRWPQSKSRVQPRLRPPTRFNAATRRAAQPAIDDYDFDEQPTTKLSSAFFVVLILHVVAVGGIYAFNSIKAHRKNREAPAPATQDNASSTRSAATTAERNEPVVASMAGAASARGARRAAA